MAYILPSVRVFQEFGVSPLSISPELNAVIIGPNKKFLDFSDPSDKQAAFAGTYDNSIDNVYQYPQRDAGDIVDQDSVEVYMDNVCAELFVGTDGETDSLEDNVLRSGTAGFYFQDFTNSKGEVFLKDASLHNRGVLPGDVIEITDGGTTHNTRVIGFENEIIDPVFGSFSADSQNHQAINFVGVYQEPTVSQTAGAGTGLFGVRGIYQHPDEDTTYTVTFTVTGALGVAEFDIVDSGSDIIGTQSVVTQAGVFEYPLGTRGLSLILDDVGATLSFDGAGPDTLSIVATAPENQNGTFATAGDYGANTDIEYTVSVVDKGGSGVARVLVTTPNDEDNSGPVVVKQGIPFEVGNRGSQAVINFPSGGVLIPGDSWTIQARGDGFGVVGPIVAAGSDETFEFDGEFSGNFDMLLEIETTTGGDFGVAVLDWRFKEVVLDAANRERIVSSGTITTSGTDDEDTVYSLDFGVGVKLKRDTATMLFVLSHVEGARLFADGMENPANGIVHDVVGDSPSLITLSALGAETNYSSAAIALTGAPAVGTASVSGKYFSSEATVYTLTVGVAGTLGTATYTVTDTGSDVAAPVLTTVAGQTSYYVGTRGLIIDFSADYDSTGLTSIDLTPTEAADMSIASGYGFDQKLVYTVSCTLGGLIGTAEFAVTSTNGVDDVANFVSAAGPNAIGTRGITVTLDDDSGATPFVVGQTWEIDTAVDSKYTAEDNNTYILEVTRGGSFGVAEVRVTSTLGDSSPPVVLQEDFRERFRGWSLPINVGNFGLLASLIDTQRASTAPKEAATFIEGDKWLISPLAREVKGYNGLKLANVIPVGLLDLSGLTYTIQIKLEDILIPEEDSFGGDNYTLDATTVTVLPGLTVQSPDVFDIVAGNPVPVDMPVDSGANVYITYCALATAGTAQLFTISNIDEIESELGRIDPRNPLSYGVFKAMQNSNIPIKYIRISSDDATGYQEAIEVLENADDVYALCPLTQDVEIHGAFKAHVNLFSTPDKSLWRIVLINQKLTTQIDILTSRIDNLGNEVELTATIIDDPNSADLNPPIFTKVVDPFGDFILNGVKPGDLFLTDFVSNSPLVPTSSYEIDQVISDDILILKDGPNTAITVAQKYEIVRPLTRKEQAENYAEIASSFKDHRVYLIWPDEAEADGQTVSGVFLCSAIAGMVAAFPKHQGFTNIGVAGFSAVPRTTEYFTQDQLNIMAGEGVMIVTQSASGGLVFIRHQVSTDNTSLELRELSITKNFDGLSYDFKAALEPFIGVWNINEDAIGGVDAVLRGRIEFNKSQSLPKIGAPLIDATINFIRQNELLKDHLDIDVDLVLPVPLNNINLTLRI